MNENEYRNFVTNEMAAYDFQKVAADDIVTKCIAEIKKSRNLKEPNEFGCLRISVRAFKCAARGIFNACPSDLQDDSEQCVKLREMINSGKFGKHDEESFESINHE